MRGEQDAADTWQFLDDLPEVRSEIGQRIDDRGRVFAEPLQHGRVARVPDFVERRVFRDEIESDTDPYRADRTERRDRRFGADGSERCRPGGDVPERAGQ